MNARSVVVGRASLEVGHAPEDICPFIHYIIKGMAVRIFHACVRQVLSPTSLPEEKLEDLPDVQLAIENQKEQDSISGRTTDEKPSFSLVGNPGGNLIRKRRPALEEILNREPKPALAENRRVAAIVPLLSPECRKVFSDDLGELRVRLERGKRCMTQKVEHSPAIGVTHFLCCRGFNRRVRPGDLLSQREEWHFVQRAGRNQRGCSRSRIFLPHSQ